MVDFKNLIVTLFENGRVEFFLNHHVPACFFTDSFHFVETELVQRKSEDVHHELAFDSARGEFLIIFLCFFHEFCIIILFLYVIKSSNGHFEFSINHLAIPDGAGTRQETQESGPRDAGSLQQGNPHIQGLAHCSLRSLVSRHSPPVGGQVVQEGVERELAFLKRK